MDYDIDILKIAVYSYYVTNGGKRVKLQQYGSDLYNKFNAHILTAAQAAGRTLTPTERTIIAVMASIAPGGSPQQCAGYGVQTFFAMQGW